MGEVGARVRIQRTERELIQMLADLIPHLEGLESYVATERAQVGTSSIQRAPSSAQLENVGRTLEATIPVLRKALADLGKLRDGEQVASRERLAAAGVRKPSN